MFQVCSDTIDLTVFLDYAGRKIMRIKDLNEQVGERTSAIFRDSKLEPLKISVTPSIARDGSALSPEQTTSEKVVTQIVLLRIDWQTSINKTKTLGNDRKRSLSSSSSTASDLGTELDAREKDINNKKGKKTSMFGNLFKKRPKKSSKDEEGVAEDGVADEKPTAITKEFETKEDSYQPQKQWTTGSTKYAKEERYNTSTPGAALDLSTPANEPDDKSDNQRVPQIHDTYSVCLL